MKKEREELSRREFAKAAAFTTAAVLVPSDLLTQEQKPPTVATSQSVPEAPKLGATSQAEADLAYDTLMKKYGTRFSDEQKSEIKRLIYQQQSGLDKLRAFAVSNSDAPATVFEPLVPAVKR